MFRIVSHQPAHHLPLGRTNGCGFSTKSDFDAVIIGGGHNGLVTAAYLAKKGLKVGVFERRHTVGGAAVTEDVLGKGYLFSRASYLLSLLRSSVVEELDLGKRITCFSRNPSSYTPVSRGEFAGKSLILGTSSSLNKQSITQFSPRDAEEFEEYEHSLFNLAGSLDPILDNPPPQLKHLVMDLSNSGSSSKLSERWSSVKQLSQLWPSAKHLLTIPQHSLRDFYELMVAPADKVLGKWFTSEPLLATLATDAVIGADVSPKTPGSAYVLLHHVMGDLKGLNVHGGRGVWAYVEGGMGAVSDALADVCRENGVEIYTDSSVESILWEGNAVKGIQVKGEKVASKLVISNATPKVTFLDMFPSNPFSADFQKTVGALSYASATTKINLAVDTLPNFLNNPNPPPNADGTITPQPHHQATIHLGCETMDELHQAWCEAQMGQYSSQLMMEMTIPSVLDHTLVPKEVVNKHHIVQLFVQWTPYHLKQGKWTDEEVRQTFMKHVFSIIDSYAPGFSSSVIGYDLLTPVDLERVFGLTGGNIFHSAMGLDQLWANRPIGVGLRRGHAVEQLEGMYLCGSGSHPGGGVQGAPGRNCSMVILDDLKRS
jgi:phytoene dehydrogenase-like protein